MCRAPGLGFTLFPPNMMLHLSRLTLALSVTVLFTGCAAGLSELPWTNTVTTTASKKVRPPNGGGRWGTLETITTCNTHYIGSTEQSRECSVAEKYIPPPQRTYSGGFFEQFAKQIVDDLVGGMIDEAMDNLANPKASPASDTPSNMTVLPPAETASAPATTLQSADNPQAQTP